jgi:hypothetical protein
LASSLSSVASGPATLRHRRVTGATRPRGDVHGWFCFSVSESRSRSRCSAASSRSSVSLVPGADLHERVELHMAGRIKAGLLRQGVVRGRRIRMAGRRGVGAAVPAARRGPLSQPAPRRPAVRRWSFLHADGAHTVRSAAGAIRRGEHVGSDGHRQGRASRGAWKRGALVVTMSVPPARPDVHNGDRRDRRVAPRVARPVGCDGRSDHAYIPFGADVSAERRFVGVAVPSVAVGDGSARRATRRPSGATVSPPARSADRPDRPGGSARRSPPAGPSTDQRASTRDIVLMPTSMACHARPAWNGSPAAKRSGTDRPRVFLPRRHSGEVPTL